MGNVKAHVPTSRRSGNGAVSGVTNVEVGRACNIPLLSSVSNSLSVLPGNGWRIFAPTSPVDEFNSNAGCWTSPLAEPTQAVRPDSESSETATKAICNRMGRATGERPIALSAYCSRMFERTRGDGGMVCDSGARRRKIDATGEEANGGGKRTGRRLQGGYAEKSHGYTPTGGSSWHEHNSPS
jgi:hypothetical protein